MGGAKADTLRDQYERILGRPVEHFDIVCFRFTERQGLFNVLSLHNNLRGLLYDSNDNFGTVTIVFEKGSQNIGRARKLALEMGAAEINPIL